MSGGGGGVFCNMRQCTKAAGVLCTGCRGDAGKSHLGTQDLEYIYIYIFFYITYIYIYLHIYMPILTSLMDHS